MGKALTKEQIEFYNELAVMSIHNVKVSVKMFYEPTIRTLAGAVRANRDVYIFYSDTCNDDGFREYLNSGCCEYIKPYLIPQNKISSLITAKELSMLSGYQLIDWYNANHIDYRGLIDKGLALEAPADMYNNQKLKNNGRK